MTVSKILDYINSNYKSNITVKKIADALFVSESSICHTFKAEYGVTVKQYILEKKTIEAKRLLEEGKRAQKVCEEVGFENYTTFYRNYKKRFGTSPSNGR